MDLEKVRFRHKETGEVFTIAKHGQIQLETLSGERTSSCTQCNHLNKLCSSPFIFVKDLEIIEEYKK